MLLCSDVLLALLETSINVKPNTSSSICVCSILNVMYYTISDTMLRKLLYH